MGFIKKSKLEISFEKDCVKMLRKLPKTFLPNKIESSYERGIPDLIFCVNGTYVALEFKRDKSEIGKSRTKLQEYVLDLVEDAGGYAAFVYPENWLIIYNDIKALAYGIAQ